MDKEELKKMARDPRFISGIYNYCDRWCERCPFTSRCLNYASGEKELDTPESRDIENQAFWDKLQETFQATIEMIREMAEEEGIDLDAVDVEEEMEEHRRIRDAARDHELSRLSHDYIGMVNGWFDSAEELIKNKEEELNLQEQLELPGSSPLVSAATIADAADVIRWYQYFIHVKLMRALQGMMEKRPEILNDFPKDSDGSAKIALIALDRSLGAWGELRRYFPEKEDFTLPILLHLDKLRRKTEKAFPEARAFVRPGFDEAEKSEQ